MKWLQAVTEGPKVGRPERRAYGDSLADILDLNRRRSSSGIPVDDDQAMRLGAVWACVDLIAELVATLPVSEYKRVERAAGRDCRVRRCWSIRPGIDSGFEVWCRQLMTSLLLRGNGFGVGGTDRPGRLAGAGRVGASRRDHDAPQRPGRGRWTGIGTANRSTCSTTAARCGMSPAYVIPGSPVGMSPIRYAAESIGVGLATQRFGAEWFRDGAHPTHVLESEHEINQEQAKILKQRLLDATRNNREPLALGLGAKLHAIQVSPEESQFLETMKANADDVARFFFRRPPGEGGSVTYANVEARSLDLLTYTLNGWLVRVENGAHPVAAPPEVRQVQPGRSGAGGSGEPVPGA